EGSPGPDLICSTHCASPSLDCGRPFRPCPWFTVKPVMWTRATSYLSDVVRVNIAAWSPAPTGFARTDHRQSHVADVNTVDIIARQTDGSRQTIPSRKLTGGIAGGRDSLDRRSRADRLYPT